MVLPNAMLAVYYSWRGQPETVYASQVGDAHVSIPLCLGVYALYHHDGDAAVFSRGHVHPPGRDAGASFLRGGAGAAAAVCGLGVGGGPTDFSCGRIAGMKN